ncbi:MAG TPA: diguanylate cyclase [Ignavibacteria bacterium]
MIKNWQENFPGAITLCDKDFVITYMNAKALKTFESDGGEKLIGTNILDCHDEESNKKIFGIVKSGTPNAYTIEKNGTKKLIYQVPVNENGEYIGLVELSLEIPFDMPHFKRT